MNDVGTLTPPPMSPSACRSQSDQRTKHAIAIAGDRSSARLSGLALAQLRRPATWVGTDATNPWYYSGSRQPHLPPYASMRSHDSSYATLVTPLSSESM
ncbi:hypothetical protein BAUCODRAFT_127502 [Baudoinia panamericana UAMH 10762]|uniref:Uncharacterized protein n=1 Tax=Baudoinia panamericana (strain UAMH 10762) TaxID=717646 RepID=M2LB62_BAUPA|nr:uncharacterized protein BAUCODRAFT_127502 [Baudoinia panamericana UAMH 10762]EMC91047.1 hypothetical protein BAUCODRAFT_127502 [Baudoinia panamericana UAMH 10762]